MKWIVRGAAKNIENEVKKARKGRPTCKKDPEEEVKKKQHNVNARYKFLNIQIEKLENMYVILTAEDGMSNLKITFIIIWNVDFGKVMDEFERDFSKLRDDSRDLKDKLKQRA